MLYDPVFAGEKKRGVSCSFVMCKILFCQLLNQEDQKADDELQESGTDAHQLRAATLSAHVSTLVRMVSFS